MARSLLVIFSAASILRLPLRIPQARQNQAASAERVVICMIRLEHADAGHPKNKENQRGAFSFLIYSNE